MPMHDCGPCSVTEDMLVEWQRAIHTASDLRTTLTDHDKHIAVLGNELESLTTLFTGLSDGDPRKRVARDIEKRRQDLVRAHSDRDLTIASLSRSETRETEYLAAAHMASTCGHEGYLTSGTWQGWHSRFSYVPWLVTSGAPAPVGSIRWPSGEVVTSPPHKSVIAEMTRDIAERGQK